MIIPRLKSVGANLVLAAFCIFWPVIMYAFVWPPFGVFLGLFLWPGGLVYVFRAMTLRVEDEFLPPAPRQPRPRVVVRETGEVREDNYVAFLEWVSQKDPGWPRSSLRRYATFLSSYFGNRRWNGDNFDPVFADAVSAYLKDRTDNPPVWVDLKEIHTSEELWHRSLRDRMELAPTTPDTHRFRATIQGREVAFVVLDTPKSSDELVLYELFVNPNERRRRVGTQVLGEIEDYAWKLRRPRIILIPRQLDPDSMSDSELMAWYSARGYRRRQTDEKVLEKLLS